MHGHEQNKNYRTFVTLLSITSHSRFRVSSVFRCIQRWYTESTVSERSILCTERWFGV